MSSRTTCGTAHGTDRANTGQPSSTSSRIIKSRPAKTETSREAARERGASAGAAGASSTQTPSSQHARQRSATEVLRAEARKRAVSLNNPTASSGKQTSPNQFAQRPAAASVATQVDAGWERVLQSSGAPSLQVTDNSAEKKPSQPAKAPSSWIAPASSDPSQLMEKKPRRAAPTVDHSAATDPDHASPDATLIKNVESTTPAEGSSAVPDNLAAIWHDSKRGRDK